MKILKQRVAVFLAFLMAFSFIASIAPSPMSTVEAASQKYFYSTVFTNNKNPNTLQVEVGTKDAFLSDFIWIDHYAKGSNSGALLSGITYSTSNKNILAVDKKTGACNAKKKGTVTVTAKYAGKTYKAKVKVVKKGALDTYRTFTTVYLNNNKTKNVLYKTYEKYATAVVKAYGKKLSGSNMFKVLKAIKASPYTIGSMGYCTMHDNNYKPTTYWLSPVQTHASAIVNRISSYTNERNPFSTYSTYCFHLDSISGSSKTVTAYFKNNVSKGQMLYLEYNYVTSAKQVSTKQAQFPITVKDLTTSKYIKATATVTLNSKKVTIKPKSKLVSGHTYKIYDEYPHEWVSYNTPDSAYTFVAK